MKTFTYFSIFLVAFMLLSTNAFAGNDQRAGTAGAQELLINPWARSSGFGNANSASIQGLEASFLNIAGIAFTTKTEVIFSRTNWLVGSEIYVNSFGFSQSVGEDGVMALTFMSMDFGDIEITTEDLPEGGIGTYSPQYMNIGLGYSRKFTENIYGGLNLKLISESIPNLNATGFAIDAGIQYVTGEEKNIRFGIALKNVGPSMQFRGDGLTIRLPALTGNYEQAVQQGSQKFELPSLLNIGASYDFVRPSHTFSIATNFTSNSFSKDQISLGLEYKFKSYLMVRSGYTYENGIFNELGDGRTTAFTGPSAGITLEAPFGKKSSSFGFDYSFRATNPFSGVHSIGARISL